MSDFRNRLRQLERTIADDASRLTSPRQIARLALYQVAAMEAASIVMPDADTPEWHSMAQWWPEGIPMMARQEQEANIERLRLVAETGDESTLTPEEVANVDATEAAIETNRRS